jgi:hypothetical protein
VLGGVAVGRAGSSPSLTWNFPSQTNALNAGINFLHFVVSIFWPKLLEMTPKCMTFLLTSISCYATDVIFRLGKLGRDQSYLTGPLNLKLARADWRRDFSVAAQHAVGRSITRRLTCDKHARLPCPPIDKRCSRMQTNRVATTKIARLCWLNSFNLRLEQTTSSAPVFKTKVWLVKYLKKSCLFWQAEQCFFKCFPKYVIRFSRRHCQKSKLGLNELRNHDVNRPLDRSWGY